ncbi:MAG: hypothetical protein ABII88_07505 [Candidatus Omnitrophota bacterium]
MDDFRKKFCLISVFIASLISSVSFVYAQGGSFLKTKVEKISTPEVKEKNRIDQLLRHLIIPEEIGSIKEIHIPNNPSEFMIITIQDLHCNYQAQKNIAAMLNYLTTTHSLRLISVEGGFGKMDTVFYQKLPDEKIKEQVADYFLKEARINGTEYFAITTDKDIALYGAEDAKYYDKNLEAFLRALPKRDKILTDIAVLENDLNILKERIYNKRLKEFDDHIVAYENGELAFEDYILYVTGYYTEDKLNREFNQLTDLVDSIKIKRDIDLHKAEEQRVELIAYLMERLARLDLEDLLRRTMEFKAKTIQAMDYNNKLKHLYNNNKKAKEKTLERQWPELGKYIVYLNKYEDLDKFLLFSELDKLVERIKNSLYTSYTQKNLDHNLRTIRLSRNLFSTKLLNRDLLIMKKYRSDFNSKKMVRFIKHQANRLGLDLPIPPGLEDMEKTLPMLEDFYHYASERNDVLVENTLQGMRSEGENIGILITGGFHTDGITEYLKDKRISYVVLIPTIDNIEKDDTRYIDALKGKESPFEIMLEDEVKALRNSYFEDKE